ncbi:MAG TPA: glutamate 5-kinase [Firmicutes bacterium]|nr:glutamate 5-kinase [Bacillota bacterium]
MRYVVKIGSSSLTHPDGSLATERMLPYVSGLAQLRLDDQQVVLVTSGAVAAGYRLAGFSQRPKALVEKQAAAAVGQSQLIQAYHQFLAPYGLKVAQLLLTASDLQDEERRQNAVNVLNYLLQQPIIPIINENDTVAVEELTFGDNDQLSALVAEVVDASALVVITDTDGLYDQNPNQCASAQRIDRVAVWDDKLLALASGSSSAGTGGMYSKLLAVSKVLRRGGACFVGRAKTTSEFLAIFSGRGKGTYFGADDQIERFFSNPDFGVQLAPSV